MEKLQRANNVQEDAMEDTSESAHEDTTQSTGDGSQLDDEEYCSESAASVTPEDISDVSGVEPDSDDEDY